jgi:asparagine synthase (glutamine-hydrolysing)
MEKRLPSDIIYRNGMGFAIPLVKTLRNGVRSYADTYVIERSDTFLSASFVQKIWDQHQSGYRDRPTQLRSIQMFRTWLEKHSH